MKNGVEPDQVDSLGSGSKTAFKEGTHKMLKKQYALCNY